MSDYQPVIPVKVRMARKTHTCDDCGKPIEPGSRYEHHVTPPNRDEYMNVARWLTWRTHYPRNGGTRQHLIGCEEAAAYREKEAREQVNGMG